MMSNAYMTDVTVTETLNYKDAYETLMNSSNVKDTLAELRLCVLSHKIAKPNTSPIISLFFKILSSMSVMGDKGTLEWFEFMEVNEEHYMFGASNAKTAMMFDKYYTKKKACEILNISAYQYDKQYAKRIEHNQNLLNIMKDIKPYYDLKHKLGLGVVIDFLENFDYLPVEKDFFNDINENNRFKKERQLELEFSIICQNLIDGLGEMIAYYFIMKLLDNYGISKYTIDTLWKNMPYIKKQLPNTPYCKSIYTLDMAAYGMARGLSKQKICRYLLKRSEKTLHSQYMQKKFKFAASDDYIAMRTVDWSGLNKNDVINFIEIFRRVAEFLDG